VKGIVDDKGAKNDIWPAQGGLTEIIKPAPTQEWRPVDEKDL
jgi:hypothetical protein